MDRVHKIIAQAGIMSRRKAEEAILAGRVSVNGEVLTELGRTVDPLVDEISIDGVKVELRTQKRTYLFYKPRGVITSKGDPQGRATVMEFFKDDPSLNPVGRLDFESEGLLILTHDGDLALKLTHPRYGVKKTYEVDVAGEITESILTDLVTGVALEDGEGKFDLIEERSSSKPEVLPKDTSSFESFKLWKASQPHVQEKLSSFNVTVSEGRNRFIRRMFEHYGLKVKRLKRIQLGEYRLGDLKPGERIEVK